MALCEGNPWVTRGSPHKGPEMQNYDVSFFVTLNKLLKETVKPPVTRDTTMLMWRHCNEHDIGQIMTISYVGNRSHGS